MNCPNCGLLKIPGAGGCTLPQCMCDWNQTNVPRSITQIKSPIQDPPDFEFWWAKYAPKMTQAEAFAAFKAAQSQQGSNHEEDSVRRI